ncbi:hypothetical protein BIV23_34830 [Streptomyces monashensis]|uniref:Uncharacterized protein n=1 Tax=Streptomyces monashensis TaxID=1678012 RepID=A0A1S2PP77_9ACTN|nr:hypothetical protein BIV23_34830 [Streptomyces monashensis]
MLRRFQRPGGGTSVMVPGEVPWWRALVAMASGTRVGSEMGQEGVVGRGLAQDGAGGDVDVRRRLERVVNRGPGMASRRWGRKASMARTNSGGRVIRRVPPPFCQILATVSLP